MKDRQYRYTKQRARWTERDERELNGRLERSDAAAQERREWEAEAASRREAAMEMRMERMIEERGY